jgi:hypothetical protein
MLQKKFRLRVELIKTMLGSNDDDDGGGGGGGGGGGCGGGGGGGNWQAPMQTLRVLL